ncbi:50S ribosomal protein L11 methyltransferase [Ammoniphilus sp. 3BR4]|uniref:50S ribosomal protein L11 methyltransferase n=1 Tax=Ammoniphilus sp. 3BR4 TaxID=3158265 RepID=UPI003467B62E
MLHEFTIQVPYADAEEAVDKLNEAGIYYVSYDTPIELLTTENGYAYQERLEATIDLKVYAEDDGTGSQPSAYKDILANALGVAEEEISYQFILTDSWQQPFEDIDLDNGWIICSPDTPPDQYPHLQYLWFDPQGAFGTGLHGTTQDCLRMILKQDFTGQSVADLGTGSGILSLAAALKGASHVDAIDIEPVEREIQYNASLNGVSSISVKQADLLEGDFEIDLSYDWIFINIGGDETRLIIERYDMLQRFRGNLLLSGLVEWSAPKIMQLLEQNGFQLAERSQTDEWVTLRYAPHI